MGRRRIEIKKIECPRARLVTFSKRRKGLFNKAAELSRLCNVDVAAVVFSPAGKIFQFGDMRLLMDRYLAGCPTSSIDSGVGHNCRSAISEIESKLSIDVSNLSLTELEEYSRVLEKMKGDLLRCFEEKQTPINHIVDDVTTSSLVQDAMIAVGSSGIQNEGFGLSPEEMMYMNNHEGAWPLAEDGCNISDMVMTQEELDLISDELMMGNYDLSAQDITITVDSNENQDDGLGLIPEEMVYMNNNEHAWRISGDNKSSDMVMTNEELDSNLAELMMGNHNCDLGFGFIDDFSMSNIMMAI